MEREKCLPRGGCRKWKQKLHREKANQVSVTQRAESKQANTNITGVYYSVFQKQRNTLSSARAACTLHIRHPKTAQYLLAFPNSPGGGIQGDPLDQQPFLQQVGRLHPLRCSPNTESPSLKCSVGACPIPTFLIAPTNPQRAFCLFDIPPNY